MTISGLRKPASLLMAATGAIFLLGGGTAVAANKLGADTYTKVCIGCHQVGVLGAPMPGDKAGWAPRLEKGEETLVKNAMDGFGNMPAKGGNPHLTIEEIRAATRYMVDPKADGTKPVGAAPVKAAAKPAPKGKAPAAAAPKGPAENKRGAEIVNQVCKGCHQIGVLGAPKIGNSADWKPRLDKGMDTLVANSIKGFGNMPAKGGRADLTEEDIRLAIRYMVEPPSQPAAVAAAPANGGSAAKAAVRPSTQRSASAAGAAKPSTVNRFNRLMRGAAERNPPPAEDGIHDPENDGTLMLQPPREAFAGLTKSGGGNYVDWVQALERNQIDPRYDRADPSKQPVIMDLNIVREVKGSMPDVVYPHKQHLEWLDCSNCHPAIFEPRKGANQISMAEILLGRKCGVCHGKVAFPVSECRRCHSKRKALEAKN